ncbi:MAG TPA: 3-deoxy-D-manno-octulosonic acid transferase [Thermodesulfobacteriaceae bacterium]|nr:3-deoxy-D-manno-octulosonic acid transferase [Thermodesulfobacteriaceae bacterium]
MAAGHTVSRPEEIPGKWSGKVRERTAHFSLPPELAGRDGTIGMLFIYNLIMLGSLPLWGPPFLLYLLAKPKYRRHLRERFGRLPDAVGLSGRSPRIWIHALSVGEVNAASVLADGIREKWPGAGIVCSAATAMGLEALRQKMGDSADIVTICPYDIPCLVRRFIRALKPECFVLVETDIWPNIVWGLKKQGVPVVLVNGRLSSRSARRLSRFRFMAGLLYGGFDTAAMQSEDDRQRLVKAGLPARSIQVLGNLKYDVKISEINAREKEFIREELGISRRNPVWVAGSTHPGEEELILSCHRKLKAVFEDLQLVLAPRDPCRGEEIECMARRIGLSVARRSAGVSDSPRDVLVLDTLGELVRCYSISVAAFVGGSLIDDGGHNLLEPAAFGVPVLFGPYIESVRELADDLAACGGGMKIRAPADLEKVLTMLLKNPSVKENMGEKARALVIRNRGAVSACLGLIGRILSDRGIN